MPFNFAASSTEADESRINPKDRGEVSSSLPLVINRADAVAVIVNIATPLPFRVPAKNYYPFRFSHHRWAVTSGRGNNFDLPAQLLPRRDATDHPIFGTPPEFLDLSDNRSSTVNALNPAVGDRKLFE